MLYPTPETVALNAAAMLHGASSPGMRGSLLSQARNWASAPQSSIGQTALSSIGNTAGGYSGGGQGPGTGSAGATSGSPGGAFGNAGGGYVGGQDPGDYTPLVSPPTDRDQSHDRSANFVGSNYGLTAFAVS